MTQTIAGFFKTRSEGEAAYRQLIAGGFTPSEVSFVAADTKSQDIPKIGPIEETGSSSEMARDASVGSVIGLAAGLVALVIPGIGPLLAIGPLAAAMGGLTAGAAAGGIIGLLKDQGVSEDEAKFYAEGVKHGGALVTVYGASAENEKKARQIMKDRGALETEELGAGRRRTFTA